MKMLMKKNAARAWALALLWALPLAAICETAGVEGTMRVAREGELPSGYFAMASGYLPGDTIAVTVESTSSSLQVLNVGSLEESEGVTMLLSKEAAAVLGITGASSAKVKLSNRSGYFDETALGYCTVKGSFVAPSKAAGSPSVAEAAAEAEAVPAAEAVPPASPVTVEKVSVVAPEEAKPVAPVVSPTPVVVAAPEPEKPVASELVLVEAPGPLEPSAVASSPKAAPVKEEVVPREELVVVTAPSGEASWSKDPVYERFEADEIKPTVAAPKPAPKAPVEELVLVEVPREVAPTAAPKEEPIAVFDAPPVIPATEVKDEPKEELFVPEVIAEVDTKDEAEDLEEDFSEVVVVYDETEPLLAMAEPKDETVDKGELVNPELPREEEIVAPVSTPVATVEEGAYSPIVLVPATSSRPPVSSKPTAEARAAVPPAPVVAAAAPAPEPAVEIKPEPVAEAAAPAPVTPAPVAASEDVKPPVAGISAEAASRVVADESSLQKDCYYIQIATLSSQKNIDSTLQKYSKYPIVLVPAANPALHKVLVGPLTVDEYGAVLSKFKAAGYKDAFVKKR